MHKSKKRILFLDIDGVLTSIVETPGSFMNHESCDYGPSPSCISRLKLFCIDNDVQVVISSNWRRYPLDYLFTTHKNKKNPSMAICNPLKAVLDYLGDIVIGMLPKDEGLTKAEAMILWFEECDLNSDDISFVILDDDENENYGYTYEYGIRNHFILTNVVTGLTDEDLEKARLILSK